MSRGYISIVSVQILERVYLGAYDVESEDLDPIVLLPYSRLFTSIELLSFPYDR